jgi:uncharacterized protein YjiS (DUF1127 family)
MSQIQISQTGSAYPTVFLVRLIDRCIESAREMHTRRNINKSLEHLSSEKLRDIGLIPDDIASINSAPLAEEAATELKVKALRRTTNW